MCGIAGIINLDEQPVPMETLKVFTDSMIHRGPDGEGYALLSDKTIGFGHRRLSILDLSEAGHQPFYYMDRYWIVYNGEVFNFNDIRLGLKEKGYRFRSDTDTEVVVAAYDCYGIACFDMFNGMWAFAIWDEKDRKMILSRDRFGVKPLYYATTGTRSIAFASETRAFKYLPGFKRSVNISRYELTLKNNYALEGLGYTIFNDIYQLLPGHYMEIHKESFMEQKRWYSILDHHITIPFNKKEQNDTLYNLFRDACRIRLISDVPVATALSGGLDSSSIYSTVYDILQSEKNERISKDSQLAVSAVFPGLENDERQYVEKAVEYTGGEVKWVMTDSDHLADGIEKDTELFDSISNAPINAISAIYKGMRREGITVSLDGHGVDEMLYGYLYMVYDLWILALEEQDRNKAEEYAGILGSLYHPDIQKTQLESFRKTNANTITSAQWLKGKVKGALGYKSDIAKRYIPADLPSLSDKPYDFSGKPVAERMLYYEFFQNSLPALLRNFDRAGMMNSVEIRMPFLDYRVVEFIFSLPLSAKIGKGFTKKIIREIMTGRMNESIRCRTFKVGIGSPFQYWADHSLKEWLYNKVAALPGNEAASYKITLDRYFGNKQSMDLEAVWYRINLSLIS